jgi:hypothetical protein
VGLLQAPTWTIVLSDSEPEQSESVIKTMPLRDKKALAGSFVREFGVGHALLESRAHGALYQLFREDKGFLFGTVGTNAAASRSDAALHYLVVPADFPGIVGGAREVTVGAHRIVAYRPMIDYTSWTWSVRRESDWWSDGVDDSSWARLTLPARQRPDPSVFAEIPSVRWPANAVVFRGRMLVDAPRPRVWLVINIRDSHFSIHQLGRVSLNGVPLRATSTVSHNTSNFRNFEVLLDLTAELRPGPNVIAFEVVGLDGLFDLDVYEVRAADPKALRSMVTVSWRECLFGRVRGVSARSVEHPGERG